MADLKKIFNSVFYRIIDFVYPTSCPICNRVVSVHGELCGDCWSSFNWIDGVKCARCGYPLPDNMKKNKQILCPVCLTKQPSIDLVRSACVYDDMSKTVMLPFKHSGCVKYSLFMSRAMIWAMRDVDIAPDIIMPVPLAWRRLFRRGYNQAALLAKPIARAYGVRVDFDSVSRKYKSNMGHKTERQRQRHISGVFNIVKPENIKGRKILLVDDVMTSGATFNELARVLKRAGATEVYGVTFCRVVRID